MPACAWVHLYGGATRRAGGELAGVPIWRSRQGFFFFPSPLEQVHLYGEATLKSWGAVLLYALVCGMTNQLIKRGVGRGGWQAHLYGEAARCVP